MKISIIVPVYNTEKYLSKCLNSLVNQTLKDIEIIIINDSSTDNSKDIIEKYRKKYDNIIVINNENNKGVSVSRNLGINKSSGVYIGFVDSDDYVELDMFETLYNNANDFEMVVCDLFEDTKISKSGLLNDLNTKHDIKHNMNKINSTLCNKIYKTSIVKNNLFVENMKYEDVEFLYRLIPKLNSIKVIDKALYHYVNRNNSQTHTFNTNWYELLDNLDIIINTYEKNNLYNEYNGELEYMYIKYTLGTFLKKMSNLDYDTFKKAYYYALDKLNKKYPKYKNNKYLDYSIRNIYYKNMDKVNIKLLYKLLKRMN